MPRAWQFLAYTLSWMLFAAGAFALLLLCLPVSLLPATPRRASRMRRVIRVLFRVWVRWLEAARLVSISWENFTADGPAGPAVYVANHPGLLDATFLLARLPESACLVKPGVFRNPVLGFPARLAGYASTEGGVDSIRQMADALGKGCSVLIFPEGTRTRAGRRLNALKPGFSLIARRAGRPVEILMIRGEHELFAHGQGAWPPPRFPSRWRIERAGRLEADEAGDSGAAVQRVEDVWRQGLASPLCA